MMIVFVFIGPSLLKGLILACMSPNLCGMLAQISHEPSRAEKPLARAESELSSDASLVVSGSFEPFEKSSGS